MTRIQKFLMSPNMRSHIKRQCVFSVDGIVRTNSNVVKKISNKTVINKTAAKRLSFSCLFWGCFCGLGMFTKCPFCCSVKIIP